MNRVMFLILFAAVILACGATPTSPPISADIGSIQTSAVQTALAGVAPTAHGAPLATPFNTAVRLLPTSMPTANPNRIEPGTYIVGKDIQPGLYQGQAGTGSCYWERLKDVSGSFDAIVANENSVGPYYVRVKNPDYALKTDCALMRLSSLPNPAPDMPTTITPGTYLVGIDIRPGTYKGQAGTDSCYWQRLKDVDGDFNSIIANDNATGQFYVQLRASDFAFTTACSLEWTQ